MGFSVFFLLARCEKRLKWAHRNADRGVGVLKTPLEMLEGVGLWTEKIKLM